MYNTFYEETYDRNDISMISIFNFQRKFQKFNEPIAGRNLEGPGVM